MNEANTDTEASSTSEVSSKFLSTRVLGGLLLALFGGLCLYLTFPQHLGLWPLVFVGFVPIYIAQYRVLPRRWSCLAVGIAFFAWWLGFFSSASSILPFAQIVIVALVIGCVGIIVGIFMRPFAERTNYRWFLVQLPLVWVAVDLLTTNNYLGSEQWIAYHLALVPQIIQPVSIVSTPALSFLIILINGAIAILIMRWMDRKWPALADVPVPVKTVRWSAAISGALAIVWLASSFVIYNQVSDNMGPTVRVAAVSPGIENFKAGGLQNTSTGRARTLEEYDADLQKELTQMTDDAANQGAQLVVWPEHTLNYDPAVTNGEWISALARDNNIYIVVGFSAHGLAQNSAYMYGPEGIMGQYNKVHPVLLEGETFVPGTTFPTFETPLGPIGVIICWDMDFPGPARLVTLTGSEIVLVPSVDFGSISQQRFGPNVFRAVENRVGVVKADRAWDSRIVQPNGQVIDKGVFTNETGSKNLLVADIARGPRGAPFTALGVTPFGFLVFFFLAWMAVSTFRTARARRTK